MLTRRQFLSGLAAVPLLRGLFRNTVVPRAQRILLLETRVAGYRFHHGPRIEHLLHEGDRLILRREPNNPHDRRAVAVDHSTGLCIGYLPRRCNETPSRLLDQEVAMRAEIVRIAPPPAASWKRVEVAIRLAELS